MYTLFFIKTNQRPPSLVQVGTFLKKVTNSGQSSAIGPIFELSLTFDPKKVPLKFHPDPLTRFRVIVPADGRTDGQTIPIKYLWYLIIQKVKAPIAAQEMYDDV